MKSLLAVLLLVPTLVFGQLAAPKRDDGWVQVKSGKTDQVRGFVNIKTITVFKLDGESVRRAQLLTIYNKPEVRYGETILGISRDVLIDCKGQTFNFLFSMVHTKGKPIPVPGDLKAYSAEADTLIFYQTQAICDVPEADVTINDLNKSLDKSKKEI